MWADRHHWLNALVGTLDAAFRLSEEEQFHVLGIISELMDALDIPFRADPEKLPSAVAHEITSGMFAKQLSAPRSSGLVRPVRPVSSADIVVSVEAWRTALLNMLLTAYPDLSPAERMMTTKVFDDLLAALGVPERLATFFPGEVVAAYRECDLLY